MNLKEKKEALIKELKTQGFLKSKKVENALRKVSRENFINKQYRDYAYANEPLPIPANQTISQPLTVVAMTEALDVADGQKVLEVGSGSGYQAAILSEIVGKKGKVFTIERIPELFEFASNNLKNYNNVIVIKGDGTKGLEKHAPFDRTMITASGPKIPEPLIEQLKNNGKLIMPVYETMILLEKDSKGNLRKKDLGFYNFVHLIGKYGYKE